MKKVVCKFIILFSILLPYSSIAQKIDIDDIRSRVEKASFDEDVAWQLLDDMATTQDKSALSTAFHGTAEGIVCLYLKNPVKLMKHAKASSKLANKAVSMDSDNLEVRFIRFTIEKNIPKVLGFSKHQDVDKAFLIQNFKKENFGAIPYNALEKMIHAMEESKQFSSKEIIAMKAELQD